MPSSPVPLAAPVPDDRPRRRRRTARVLLLDADGSVFLWHDSDPWADGKPQFWITAGGGVDSGESDIDAAVREVREELGLVVDTSELVGPLAERVVVHGYSDVVQLQEEVFFAIRVNDIEPNTEGHTPEEQVTFQGFGWWTAAELEDTVEQVFPAGLAELVRTADRALKQEPGARPTVVVLPDDEESTVAAGEPVPSGTADSHRPAPGEQRSSGTGQMSAEEWDRRYRGEPGLWGTEVTPAAQPVLVALNAERGEGRRAVDLASGSGRHALWLAAHGWQVSAVDFAGTAVAQGRDRSMSTGIAVDWTVADALSWEPDAAVDLVLVTFLQLPADPLRELLERAASWLRAGGSLLYVGHARDNLEHGTGGPSRPEVLPGVEDLAAAAHGYEIRTLGHVRRPVAGHRDAIDIVLWLRPWPAEADTGS